MNPVRFQAFRLRMLGYSYNEIRKEISVSKSTLSLWLRDVVLSDKARKRLDSRMRSEGAKKLIALNKLQTHKAERRAHQMHTLAAKRVPKITKRDLLIIGAVLYWAEGYKRLHVRDGKERMGHTISFVNSDPVMIKAFLRFLREVIVIPDNTIHLTMRLHPHINEKIARKYWMNITKFPSSCFQKTTNMVSSASKGKRPYNRLPYGTLQVAVYNTVKFHYLLGLIKGVQAKI